MTIVDTERLSGFPQSTGGARNLPGRNCLAGLRDFACYQYRCHDAPEPQATVSLHSQDMAWLGLSVGQMVRAESRQGEICLALRQAEGTPLGVLFIPFAHVEAAANTLTNSEFDPSGKIP